jgi:hypothetical protein
MRTLVFFMVIILLSATYIQADGNDIRNVFKTFDSEGKTTYILSGSETKRIVNDANKILKRISEGDMKMVHFHFSIDSGKRDLTLYSGDMIKKTKVKDFVLSFDRIENGKPATMFVQDYSNTTCFGKGKTIKSIPDDPTWSEHVKNSDDVCETVQTRIFRFLKELTTNPETKTLNPDWSDKNAKRGYSFYSNVWKSTVTFEVHKWRNRIYVFLNLTTEPRMKSTINMEYESLEVLNVDEREVIDDFRRLFD